MQFQLILSLAVLSVCSFNPAPQASAHIYVEMPENIRKMAIILHEHCVKETGIDEDWTMQLIKGAMPEDRSVGCYLHCMFDTVGLVSPEGHIRFQDVMHLLPQRHQEIIADVVRRCDTIHGDNACETAYLTVECYVNQTSAQTFFKKDEDAA